jgi:hypothetical protein
MTEIEKIFQTDKESSLKTKIKSWLGIELKIILTDKRIIYGKFVCVDKSLNFLLISNKYLI